MPDEMLSAYRELRITLTEVPHMGDHGLVTSTLVDWTVRAKPLVADWGTGTILASGRLRRDECLDSPEEAGYYLERVLTEWLDRRQ